MSISVLERPNLRSVPALLETNCLINFPLARMKSISIIYYSTYSPFVKQKIEKNQICLRRIINYFIVYSFLYLSKNTIISSLFVYPYSGYLPRGRSAAICHAGIAGAILRFFREGNGMHLYDDNGNLRLCHYQRITGCGEQL